MKGGEQGAFQVQPFSLSHAAGPGLRFSTTGFCSGVGFCLAFLSLFHVGAKGRRELEGEEWGKGKAALCHLFRLVLTKFQAVYETGRACPSASLYSTEHQKHFRAEQFLQWLLASVVT